MLSHDLTKPEIEFLKKIEHGEFEDCLVLPNAVNQLITKGLVEGKSIIIYPIMPHRKTYHLTVYGRYILDLLQQT